jgi:hypothetical protein
MTVDIWISDYILQGVSSRKSLAGVNIMVQCAATEPSSPKETGSHHLLNVDWPLQAKCPPQEDESR